jgi:membrane protease YdiL (CAAX protease family)
LESAAEIFILRQISNMKFSDRFRRMPVILRVAFYLGTNYALLFAAQIISGFLPLKSPLITNLLLCALLILFTALVLKWEGLSWTNIGCTPTSGKGLKQLLCGTLYGMTMLLAVAFTIKMITGFEWQLDPAFRWQRLLPVTITVFASVVAQELAFRGYAFHVLWRKWGEWPTQILLAVLFGCMHLSDNMSLQDILLTMLTTGIGSLLFGVAVIKTKQIHLAVGIHFGWNLLQLLLPRSVMQNGEGIWRVSGGTFNPDLGLLIWTLPYFIVAIMMFLILKLSIPGKTRDIDS